MFIRESHKQIVSRLNEPRKFIQVLAGPRQVGKTTLTLQCLKKIKIPFHYVSADESGDLRSVWIDQQWETARMKMNSAKECVLVIDEIQKIHEWSQTVKKNWDRDSRSKIKLKVILLGSSQLLIQKGLTESLAGRFEITKLPHWSFVEMKSAFKFTPEEYVWFGGYPGAAQLRKDASRWQDYILHSLIETTISKDILMLSRVDKPALLRHLFELGCTYCGQILSYTKMLGQLHDAGNTTTLSHYLKLLDMAGLMCGVEKFSGSSVQTRSSSPKVQVKDTALLSIFSGLNFLDAIKKPDIWGRHVESAVGAHLVNSAETGAYSVYYWRHRNDEIDFVLKRNEKLIGIEIKSNSSSKISGAAAFQKYFKPDKILLIGESGIKWQDFLKMNPGELFS